MAEGRENEDDRVKKALAKRYRELQVEQQKREIVKKFLDPDAYERLMNVRVANRELYMQIIDFILSMAQSNRISGRLSDEQLRSILTRLTYKPETKIEFKHK